MDIDHANDENEPDLSALANRLAAWRPSIGALDRDRTLYRAGWSAARADGHIQAWRVATAALMLLTISLGGLLARQSSLIAREGELLAQSGRSVMVSRRPSQAASRYRKIRSRRASRHRSSHSPPPATLPWRRVTRRASPT